MTNKCNDYNCLYNWNGRCNAKECQKQRGIKTMTCDICKEDLQPLDAHMGRLCGELVTTHIDCWNKELDKKGINTTT